MPPTTGVVVGSATLPTDTDLTASVSPESMAACL